MSKNRVEIPQSVMAIVRRKTTQLRAQRRISREDADDVAQSLYLKVTKALPAHDPSKGSVEAFAQTVVNRAAANVIRDQRAAKRAPGRAVSLHVMIKLDDGEYGELAQTISQRELSARTGAQQVNAIEAFERAHDIAELIAQHAHSDRELLRRLKRQSAAEAARDLEAPPSTIRSRIQKFLGKFEDGGLRD
jgi:RNA polymerase sigma factor (sigma-70 family)